MQQEQLIQESHGMQVLVRGAGRHMTPENLINQRRMVWRVLTYWEQKRGNRDYPSLSDISEADIPDLWPSCYILDVENYRDFPYFHYLGGELAKYSGVFLSGQDWALTLLKKTVCHYREALERASPILVEEELTQYNNQRLLFRSVLLPLSDDQSTINYMLGAANGTIRRD